MTLIVNLSTTHDYSLDDTVAAFVELCNEYSKGCLQAMPGFFQKGSNYLWVKGMLLAYYSTYIEPYKLGKIDTKAFLENLSSVFNFMDYMDEDARDKLLIDAWNTSIKITEFTKDRLRVLVQKAESGPVYLIANTNELNVRAILSLYQEMYPDLEFKKDIDIGIHNTQSPIEILPNIFLCLSYQYGTFKTKAVTTMGLLENLSTKLEKPISVVSQYSGDREKAKELGLEVLDLNEFYRSASALQLI